MAFQNKPLHRPTGSEHHSARDTIHSVLLAATETGARAIGCTGASFVTSSMGIWMEELVELDAKNTAKFMQSLATLADPSVSHNKKVAAEKKRRSAVEKLMQAVDLDMQTTGDAKH